MPPAERAAGPRQPGTTRLTVALWLALVAAITPLTGVIRPGVWFVQSVGLSALLLAIGWGARRLRVPAAGVTAIEVAAWIALITGAFFGDTAWFGFVPTVETLRALPGVGESAVTQIIIGIAPLEPVAEVSVLIVAAVGLLTVALDHVVVTARMPLLATIALVAVWVIPAIAVPSAVNVVSFVFLAAAVLFTIRADTRAREAPGRSGGGVAVVAAGIATAAIMGAVIAAPVLPEPAPAAGGAAAVTTIDPTLELGDDLRRPEESVVLRYRTDATSLPYLRIATLSLFDGDVWLPDRLRTQLLEPGVFEPVTPNEGIRVTEYETTVEVTDMSSAWAPVPFPAVDLRGLEGLWRLMPYNRTVFTSQGNVSGQQYTVTTQVPRPTLEQIRASAAVTSETRADLFQLPQDLPDIVYEQAQAVTEGAETDYDRLRALQSWFRGPEFEYSLTAPVQEGFDGTSAEAIGDFLEVRSGYCVHFSAAFAAMARVLNMPARVVVGFLPGGYTGDIEDGQRVAEATTGQLHAWPEVYFDGIGWIGFEPTKGLGEQTSFLSESVAPPPSGGEDIAGPTPTATATPTASVAPIDPSDPTPNDDAAASVRLSDLRPYLSTIGVLLVAGAAPAVARAIVEHRLRRRAAAGSVAAAWRIVQNTALDIGAPVPAALSPRAFGASLARRGARGPAVDRLVSAIEHASYAADPAGSRADAATASPRTRATSHATAARDVNSAPRRAAPTRRGSTEEPSLLGDALTVRGALLTAADRATRARALLLPRSLLIRPGSSFATPAPLTAARG